MVSRLSEESVEMPQFSVEVQRDGENKTEKRGDYLPDAQLRRPTPGLSAGPGYAKSEVTGHSTENCAVPWSGRGVAPVSMGGVISHN